MSSTTSSDPSSENILKITKLNLTFKLRQYQNRSFRDSFVSLVSSPISTLLNERGVLHILKDVTLRVGRGDRLALIGVNGSGKTSLCRTIAGMFTPDSGQVSVHGSQRAVFNSQVCIVPELTGRENARLFGRLLFPTASAKELNELVDEALDFSDLRSFLDSPYEIYSQGMKSRLCLSLITAKPCDLLILDEIYDNTDEFFHKKMEARLDRFIGESGAVIFVSHSAEYVRRICNRAAVLHESKIAYDGTVEGGLKTYRFLNGEIGVPAQ